MRTNCTSKFSSRQSARNMNTRDVIQKKKESISQFGFAPESESISIHMSSWRIDSDEFMFYNLCSSERLQR